MSKNKNQLEVKVYTILEECVESGINWGFLKAFKHEDNPSEDKIKEEVLRAVMLSISEKFNFPEFND
jgi:hypothetical protein